MVQSNNQEINIKVKSKLQFSLRVKKKVITTSVEFLILNTAITCWALDLYYYNDQIVNSQHSKAQKIKIAYF